MIAFTPSNPGPLTDQLILSLFPRDYATSSATRRLARIGYETKASSNVSTLSRIVSLRREAATLLGFEDWATFILEERLAKTPENVMNFLSGLESKLMEMARKERDELLSLKREKEGNEQCDDLYIWDLGYYRTLWEETNLKLGESSSPYLFSRL